MGAQESRSHTPGNFMYDFEKQYMFLKEITDKRFGEVQIYKHKVDDKYIAKRSQLCNTNDDFVDFVKKAKFRKSLEHNSLITILHMQDANSDALCGDFNKLSIFFDYFFLDLEKELLRRREKSEFLTESELWYLLDSLVSVGYYLQKYNIYHGDYKPSNILLTSDGEVKIGDHGILHVDQSGYFKALSGREKALLSPNQLFSLKNREMKAQHNYWKSDVFALGMTLLETASLCQPFQVYDFSTYEIQQDQIEGLINGTRGRYGSFFLSIIRDMLILDENKRPSFDELYQVLLPYQNQIQNFADINPATSQVQFQSSQVVQQPLQQSVVQAPLPTYTIINPPQTIQASQVIGQNQVVVQPQVLAQSQQNGIVQNGTELQASQQIIQNQPITVLPQQQSQILYYPQQQQQVVYQQQQQPQVAQTQINPQVVYQNIPQQVVYSTQQQAQQIQQSPSQIN